MVFNFDLKTLLCTFCRKSVVVLIIIYYEKARETLYHKVSRAFYMAEKERFELYLLQFYTFFVFREVLICKSL